MNLEQSGGDPYVGTFPSEFSEALVGHSGVIAGRGGGAGRSKLLDTVASYTLSLLQCTKCYLLTNSSKLERWPAVLEEIKQNIYQQILCKLNVQLLSYKHTTKEPFTLRADSRAYTWIRAVVIALTEN